MHQAGERVHLLVNKMMMESQINLVGEGYNILSFIILILFLLKTNIEKILFMYTMSLIFVVLLLRLVGRAAVTGCHQWFHSEDFSRVVHPPEVHVNVLHKFHDLCSLNRI